MVSFESKPYSKKLLHLISWSHWFTFFNIIAAILLSTVYLINEASPETLTGHIYLITTWLSHMAFLTFIIFVLSVFPLTLLIPRTRFIRASASVIFTIVLVLLLLDAFVYSRLGYHINASSGSQIIELISSEIREDRRSFWFVTIVVSLLILTFELLASNYAWKHLQQLQKTVFARFIVFGLVVAFFISHLMHIWADANLEYDVLKQDTILPMSYPTTAKTLLTKYGLFNKDDYMERKTSPLSFNEPMPSYPVIGQCNAQQINNTTFLILSKQTLSADLIEQFAQRSTSSTIRFNQHIDNATTENAWFNLFYGLPTIYQQTIKESGDSSVLFQALKQLNLKSSFTQVNSNESNEEPIWFLNDFGKSEQKSNIASMIFPDELAQFENGLHTIYFSDDNTYQMELFVDALLLAQKQKTNKDNIIISSIGNQDISTNLSNKLALAIWPSNKSKRVNRLSSQMDVVPTLLKRWLNCGDNATKLTAGDDLFKIKRDRVIANTVDNGMVVFNKDKSVFIDQNGNFQSYSSQLSAPITESSDFPLMIDGVHFIKRFSQHQQHIGGQ
ncbi:DUF3413 domain-containing protein [Thalassotalea sp. M1531]|uniref:DUF3413 domain-containing protein n=1 Tax=Thalassotalea algicola TaxID=2716224 RepID=A0A7Y0LD47_9GAMM|nr:DUF3413 domain-containing protein [Thalassotalea algicola]NMP32353.1 DUF3413 domain-containing protein [Thalassotalea algicola]